MFFAKTIDELYSEVRDYDLVLCNDAPLALALNNRVDRARLGTFAYTARQYAAATIVKLDDEPLIDDIELVRRISDITGYSLRFVHAEVENIRRMMRFISDPRQHLGKRSRKIWDAFTQYKTLDLVMSRFDSNVHRIYDGMKVAVIGLDLFDNLDKCMLPPWGTYDPVEVIDEKRRSSIDEIRLLGNDKQIADCAADIVGRSDPNDVAIVIETSGPMADAVRSALYRNLIPFINSMSMKNIHAVRNYIQFLNLSLDCRALRVKDARNMISSYGGYINPKNDEYYLCAMYDAGLISDERAVELVGYMKDIRDHTFSEICDACVPSRERSNIRMLLSQMACADDRVSQSGVDDLFYAVNNIGSLSHNEQIPADEKEGVLLVDCKNSVYIDRPIVIYAGMCTDWNRDMKGLDFLSIGQKEDFAQYNDMKFCAMIQQGSVRFFLANATDGGEESIPCVHFERCFVKNRSINRFSDITDNIVRGMWKIDRKDRGVEHDCMDFDVSSPPPRYLSASSFNKYHKCPRSYMLSRTVLGPSNEHTVIGDMIHQYMEFRVSYPEIACRNPPEYYADIIAEKCIPLIHSVLAEKERDMIRMECIALDSLIGEAKILPGDMRPRSGDKKDANVFLDMYGLNEVSDKTEKKMMDIDNRMEGDMDLFLTSSILDLKTGKKKENSDLKKVLDFRISKPESFDSQPLFYLALCRACGYRPLNFDYFFSGEYYRASLTHDPTVNDCKVGIRVTDSDYDMYCQCKDMNINTYKGKGPQILDILFSYPQDEWDGNTEIMERMKELKIGITNMDKYNTVVRKVKGLRDSVALSDGDSTMISEETLGRFTNLVRERYDEISSKYVVCGMDAFAANPSVNVCKYCDYRDMCLMDVEQVGDSDE